MAGARKVLAAICTLADNGKPTAMISKLIRAFALSFLGLVFGCKNDNPTSPELGGLADPSFRWISPSWVDQVSKQRMDIIWQSQSLNAKGQNYYLFTKAAQGRQYSERFNPMSKYFQAWFGAYTVEDNGSSTYALIGNTVDAQAIISLAIADQIAWLTSFAGLSQPTVYLDSSMIMNVAQVQIDGRSGWRITGRLISNIDTGINNVQTYPSSLLVIPRDAWQSLVVSYATIKLDVVSYVWYAPENKELTVVYYNGVDFVDLMGVHHQTIPLIESELDSMALRVTVHR